MDITIDEVQAELEAQNFEGIMVRRFGTENNPMPICMAILSDVSKTIFQTTEPKNLC